MKIIIIVIVGIFILGYSIGSNTIPFDDTIKSYYSKLTSQNYYEKHGDDIPLILHDTDVKSLIHINNENDIMEVRENIIDYIWKEEGFSKNKIPSKIEYDFQDERFIDLESLEKIDKLTITMEYGIESYVYIFLAEHKNENFILYHQGHDGDFVKGKETIEFFLKEGYSVAAFAMPLMGMNNQPEIDIPGVGEIKFSNHEHFRFIDSDNFSSMKLFFDPLMITTNYIENNFDVQSIFMIGISGGGWTTTVYSAIDDRIDKSFPVGSMLPLYISLNSPILPHYESSLQEFYKIASYLDLYILGSFGEGREQVKIINKFDSCCHGGITFQTFEDEISDTMMKLNNGSFTIFLDDTHNGHKISNRALEVILESIQ